MKNITNKWPHVVLKGEEEAIFYMHDVKCSLVNGKVKVLDVFSKPFSLLEQILSLKQTTNTQGRGRSYCSSI